MIELNQGDILKAEADAIVNTVNCVGVMGRGIALQFKKAYPHNFIAYQIACKNQELSPGKLFIHPLQSLYGPKYIVNFPTKRHWKDKSRLEDIQAGLKSLVKALKSLPIESIAIPPLGCGLGGLNWADVRPLIEKAFEELPQVKVFLFEPTGAPKPEDMSKHLKPPNMTKGRAALIGLIRQYLGAVMDPSVTLLEIHKLMYFMQVSGEDLRLNFEKGNYGPYAKNLRHVLNVIEGHFIQGYGDADDNPEKQIELLPGSAEKAESILQNHPDTKLHFERVADLIQGFETPFGMELLTTVHWVTAQGEARSLSEAKKQIYAWSSHKQMFQPQHVKIAWDILHQKGWLNTLPG